MITRCTLLLASSMLLTSCAAPQFCAAWYLIEHPPTCALQPVSTTAGSGGPQQCSMSGDGKPPQMLLAVANRSGRNQTLTAVIVNQATDKPNSGWQWLGSPASSQDCPKMRVELSPGQVLTVPMADFRDMSAQYQTAPPWPDRCTIPTDILLVLEGCDPDQLLDLNRRCVRLALNQPMPTSLPLGWENCPKK